MASLRAGEESRPRAQTLIAIIDKTIAHVRGTKKISNEEMLASFQLAPGKARFAEEVKLAANSVLTVCPTKTGQQHDRTTYSNFYFAIES